jgi:hypothetical protein
MTSNHPTVVPGSAASADVARQPELTRPLPRQRPRTVTAGTVPTSP